MVSRMSGLSSMRAMASGRLARGASPASGTGAGGRAREAAPLTARISDDDDSAVSGSRKGSSTRKVAPLPGPGLRAETRPPCSTHQPFHQGQPQPQPAAARLLLHEHAEDVGQQVVGDAPAVVLDLDDHLVVGLLAAQDDPAALVGVADGVVQQVGHHLGDAARRRRT